MYSAVFSVPNRKLNPDRQDSDINFAPHRTQTSIWELTLFFEILCEQSQ